MRGQRGQTAAEYMGVLFLAATLVAAIAGSGLGDGIWWVQPAFLYLEQLNPDWQVFGEFPSYEPGTYTFICTLHEEDNMRMTIVVRH